MTIARRIVTIRVHPPILPSKEATADKTESEGDEEVISAGC